jgi:hypothetical protein
VSRASLYLENCEIRNNTARFIGGGIGVADPGARAELRSCDIRGNLVQFGYGGGALVGAGASLKFFGGRVRENSATLGGGVLASGWFGAERDTNGAATAIESNTAVYSGAGVTLFGGATAELNHTLFHGNRAPAGAALSASHAFVNLNGAQFLFNEATGNAIVELNRCVNSVANSVFARNTTPGDGVFRVARGSGDIVHCVFAFNETNGSGSGAALQIVETEPAPAPILRVINNIFAYNQGFGIAEVTSLADPELRNNLFYGDSRGEYLDEGATPINTTSAMATLLNNAPQARGGNLVAPPSFRRPQFNDYRLMGTSPAVDMGYTLAAPDLALSDAAGAPRTGPGAGAAPDAGAWEVVRPQLTGPAILIGPSPDDPQHGDVIVLSFNRRCGFKAMICSNPIFTCP